MAKFEGISFGEGAVSYKKDGGPLAGARAEVEAVGQVGSRTSLTRIILTGGIGLFWKKKADRRELYVKVQGRGFEFVAPVDPKKGAKARVFVAQLNSAAMEAEQLEQSTTSER